MFNLLADYIAPNDGEGSAVSLYKMNPIIEEYICEKDYKISFRQSDLNLCTV